MSIKWGDLDFDGPYPITNWDPPYRAAVYAIMYKQDLQNKPTEYTIIYFGESGNLDERGFYRSHHKYNCWIEYAGTEESLYIAIYLMPDSNPEDRRKVEKN